MNKLSIKQKCISDVEALLTSDPVVANFFQWETKFLNDMLYRLKKGYSLSVKQKSKLDELICNGYPQMPVLESDLGNRIASTIEKMSNYTKFNWDRSVILDFQYRLLKNYDLSEKQIALCERIIKSVNDVCDNSISITEEIEKRCKDIINASKCYIGLSGKKLGAVEKIYVYQTEPITMKEIEYAEEAVKTKLKEIQNPSFKIGDLVWYRGVQVLILSDIKFLEIRYRPGRHDICYDIWYNEKPTTVPLSSLKKRK